MSAADSINRQWLLVRSPQGQVRVEDFARRDAPVPVADLGAGEILIRTVMVGFDPAQRGWMDDAPSYMPPMAIGEPVRGSAAARVAASANHAYPEGVLVRGLFSWQDYAVAARTGEAAPVLIPDDVTPEEAPGVLGGASLTACVGLKTVGRVRPGDTVLVSGAAGAVGSMAVQIARLNGARVIGIAGGPEKCRWLVEDYGADAAIDYRSEDVRHILRDEACFDTSLEFRTLIGLYCHPFDVIDSFTNNFELELVRDGELSTRSRDILSALSVAFPSSRAARLQNYLEWMHAPSGVGPTALDTGTFSSGVTSLPSAFMDPESSTPDIDSSPSEARRAVARMRWSRYPNSDYFESATVFAAHYRFLDAGRLFNALNTSMYMLPRKEHLVETRELLLASVDGVDPRQVFVGVLRWPEFWPQKALWYGAGRAPSRARGHPRCSGRSTTLWRIG